MDQNKYMLIKSNSFSRQGYINTFIKQYKKGSTGKNWNDTDKIKCLCKGIS